MESKAPTMKYRIMPGTGLKVSVIGYGHMLTTDTPEMQIKLNEIIKESWDLGINFYDNAEV
jgi:aryl-alcohol dehydrogenase-like predicted oxidoreductase